ncbi:probable esterase PIR7A [Benincasa hispida]|uniref:probable esterase PIR7A n=1 Tax=Benincasa hispida TaxID=102211 RepID=UPI00190173CA|nr:probable esterase PIR7A [Benincasa hispida]
MQKLLLLFFLLIFLCFCSQTQSSSVLHDDSQGSKSHIVLVHGACLGAWSWYKVTTLLQTAGHNVTALDMAASGINPTQAESLTSLTEYYQPLLSFMEALAPDEKIVLVGHSLGGLGISMAMERFPEKISVAIFVSAAMPGPILGLSSIEEQKKILEMYSAFYTEEKSKASNPDLFLFSQEDLETKLFPLSPPEDLTLATTLVRPQAMFGLLESMKELQLSQEKYGSVKRAFIISEKDQMTTKIMVWAMLIFNKPDRVAEVKGSDHMVMTSKPLELTQQLSTIAQDFSSSSTYINM